MWVHFFMFYMKEKQETRAFLLRCKICIAKISLHITLGNARNWEYQEAYFSYCRSFFNECITYTFQTKFNNIFSSPLCSKCYVDSLDKQIADIVVSIAEYLYRDKRNILILSQIGCRLLYVSKPFSYLFVLLTFPLVD